jgi:hypothetical protein
MKESIEMAKDSKWSEEALARAQFHLSMIYKEQGVQLDEARNLEQQAVSVLVKYSNSTPDYLRGVEERMLLFDDLQPAEGGRFTGRGLLRHMQEWSRSSGKGKTGTT